MSNKNKTLKPKNMVDVVIPVYGNYKMLPMAINYLDKSFGDASYKIYLVDDCSPDYETNKDIYKQLRLNNPHYGGFLYHNKNAGFPKTVNDGVKMGNSEYILLLNTDVFLMENSAKIMLEQLQTNDDIGITSPKLLFMPNSVDKDRPGGKIQHAGVVFDISGRPYHRFVGWDANHPAANRVIDINAVTGACFMVKRKLWYQLKGLDEQYGQGTYEDIDFCIRTRMTGMKIRYLPQAVGFHYTNASVLETKMGFPTERNYNLFKAKFGQVIPLDEFLFTL